MDEFKAVNNEKLIVVRTWVRQEPFIKIVDGSVTVDGYRDGRYQQCLVTDCIVQRWKTEMTSGFSN